MFFGFFCQNFGIIIPWLYDSIIAPTLSMGKREFYNNDIPFFINPLTKKGRLFAFLFRFIIFYFTLILVALTFSAKISAIEYFADAIMTSVPCAAASLIYSNLAFAPFAPFLDAPWQ